MITPADFDYIRTLVRERSAIVLGDDKLYLAETRLHGLAQKRGAASIHHMVEGMRRQPFSDLHQLVVEAMTTNETFFFRDQWPFDMLAQRVIPELAARRAQEKQVVIWSAASSTGQEPYSIAMILLQSALRAPGWRIKILATDLNQQVLERTRAGRYTRCEIERGLAPDLRDRYFRPDGNDWVACNELRAMLETQVLNLAQPWPSLPTADIIFLRNVLIYFDLDTRRDILGRARRLLRPDGYLFLGGSENVLGLEDSFERVPEAKFTYYRVRTRN